MCAIFGYVARGTSTVSIATLAAVVRGNVARGPHSFGFAWVNAAGRLHCFKQAGRVTDFLGVLAMARGARMLVGHLRYATHGDPRDNINNHPHPADGGWIVHNGVVANYRQLVRDRRLWTVSECDSEVLGLLIERSGQGTPLRRCAEAVEATAGSLAMMGLWSRPGALVVARRGNPLHASETPEGVYLATLPVGLPAKPLPLAGDTVRAYTRDARGSIRVRRITIESGEASGPLFDAEGRYAGG